MMCDFTGIAQVSVTLTLDFQDQTGTFTTIINFREKVLFNYDLSDLEGKLFQICSSAVLLSTG